jgi:hypothetical protein
LDEDVSSPTWTPSVVAIKAIPLRGRTESTVAARDEVDLFESVKEGSALGLSGPRT